MQLTPDHTSLVESQVSASFTKQQLKRELERRFASIADEVSWDNGKAEVVYQVVQQAIRTGELESVIAELQGRRPLVEGLMQLRLFLSVLSGGRGPYGVDARVALGGLEQLRGRGNPFVSALDLAQLLLSVPNQVCQIRVPQNGGGTGFLIGPSLVLTCFHVVEHHIRTSNNISVRFDFVTEDHAGEWIGLDTSWEIPYARYSTHDLNWPYGLPRPSELDFAVLKLARAIGNERIGPPDADRLRGWVDLTIRPPAPVVGEAGVVIGHPGTGLAEQPQLPLSVSFEARAFESINENQTRIAYAVDTRPGSSGSPVFNRQMQPVVLHHNRGEPYEGPPAPGSAEWSRNNRGIPLCTIWDVLPVSVKSALRQPR